MTLKAFDPNQISTQKFKPLNDTVIVSDMAFDQRITSSGIILLNDNGKGTGIRPRWGRVYAVGPKQKDVLVGQWICVAHGRWTRGVEVEDEAGPKTIRKIDPKDILLVADQQPQDDTMSDAVHVDAKR
jgi:co-chaperonin GroES (HSP10)